MPKFSVIVPVYNAEKYLHRCVDSILAQTFTDFELLLVNDGSTDSSGSICDEYAVKDNRVRVFHKKNGGASSARNLGLDNVKGEWDTFCDADDWVYETWLSNFARNIKNADIVAQGLRYDKLNIGAPFVYNDVGFDYSGDILGLLSQMHDYGLVGYTVIKCFKNELIQTYKLRFNEKYELHEDEEFVIRYLIRCKVAYAVKNVGYHYIMPDFEKKYIVVKNGFDLYKSLLLNVLKIDCNSSLANYYLNMLTDLFIKEFICLSFNKRWFLLMDYKAVLGKMIMKTRLFFLTKWIIRMDVTGVFSTLLLSIHCIVKKM